jgi:hypothetical protein
MTTTITATTTTATPVTKSRIHAYYTGNSWFDVDFDINAVHDWWIKWDTLYVIHNEGEEEEEYEPFLSADEEMLKRPVDIEVE